MNVQERFLDLALGQGAVLVEAIAAWDEVYLAPAALTRLLVRHQPGDFQPLAIHSRLREFAAIA